MTSVFGYQAMSPDGSIGRGSVEAADEADARRVLAGRGLFALEVGRATERHDRRDHVSPTELALGLRILADLLESGLPVARALQTFEDLAPSGWRRALPDIRQSIREGKNLGMALSGAPIAIPPLVVGIIQAGEAGTGIGLAVRRAADLMESAAEMRSAVRSALAYPTLVAVAGIAAITALVTVVLPRFALILGDLGQTLPASTRLVLSAATLARAALLPGALALVALIGLWAAWVQTEAGRAQWHSCLLTVPWIGKLRGGIATARMAHSLAALLESGVTIGAALKHAARATGDACIEARVLAARERITSGQTLSHSLDTARAATITAIRLVRAGEESGRVALMLAHAARIEQQRTDRIIRTAVRMLEPVLLLAFAGIVALVAAALLQAIYSVRPTP
jgi:type II secretory pathway component PulF